MSEQIKGPIWPYHNQIFYITTIISRLPLQTIFQWHSEIIPLRLAVLVGYYNPCPFSMDSHWDQRHSWIILDLGPSPTCPISSWPNFGCCISAHLLNQRRALSRVPTIQKLQAMKTHVCCWPCHLGHCPKTPPQPPENISGLHPYS